MLPTYEEMSGALAAWNHVASTRTSPNGIFIGSEHDAFVVDRGYTDDLVYSEL